jgi:hypothetical protein
MAADATDRADRAIYDVLLRSLALDELDQVALEQLDLAHVRLGVDDARANHDFIALRRALVEEAAAAIVLLKRLPSPARGA